MLMTPSSTTIVRASARGSWARMNTVCGCSSMRSLIWCTLPSARMRPLLISRMFDVIASTSWRMWLETMMLLPARAHSLIWRIVRRRMIGIRHQCLRQLDPLPHAFAVGPDLLPRGVHEIHRFERARRRRLRLVLAESIQPHERRHPGQSGHAFVKRVLFRTEPDAAVQL